MISPLSHRYCKYAYGVIFEDPSTKQAQHWREILPRQEVELLKTLKVNKVSNKIYTKYLNELELFSIRSLMAVAPNCRKSEGVICSMVIPGLAKLLGNSAFRTRLGDSFID